MILWAALAFTDEIGIGTLAERLIFLNHTVSGPHQNHLLTELSDERLRYRCGECQKIEKLLTVENRVLDYLCSKWHIDFLILVQDGTLSVI